VLVPDPLDRQLDEATLERFGRQWGSDRSLASARYQARYVDPDTRQMSAAEAHANWPGRDQFLTRAGPLLHDTLHDEG
jgi:hypothetical protein